MNDTHRACEACCDCGTRAVHTLGGWRCRSAKKPTFGQAADRPLRKETHPLVSCESAGPQRNSPSSQLRTGARRDLAAAPVETHCVASSESAGPPRNSPSSQLRLRSKPTLWEVPEPGGRRPGSEVRTSSAVADRGAPRHGREARDVAARFRRRHGKGVGTSPAEYSLTQRQRV